MFLQALLLADSGDELLQEDLLTDQSQPPPASGHPAENKQLGMAMSWPCVQSFQGMFPAAYGVEQFSHLVLRSV